MRLKNAHFPHTHAKPLGDPASTKGAIAANGQGQLANLPGQRAPQPSCVGSSHPHVARSSALLRMHTHHALWGIWYGMRALRSPSQKPPPASSTCGCTPQRQASHISTPIVYTHPNTDVGTGRQKERAATHHRRAPASRPEALITTAECAGCSCQLTGGHACRVGLHLPAPLTSQVRLTCHSQLTHTLWNTTQIPPPPA